MVLYIRLLTLARPLYPPAHVAFHLRALCVRTNLVNQLKNKGGLFDPVKNLQLYGLKIKFYVVL